MKDKCTNKVLQTQHSNIRNKKADSNFSSSLVMEQFELLNDFEYSFSKALQHSKNSIRYYSLIIRLNRKFNVSSLK